MKIKNIKAQSKRTKLEFVDTDANDESNDNHQYEDHGDGDGSGTDFKFSILNAKRKRCKKFSSGDCDLLIELYEKYCTGLDTSSAATSVKRRNESWDMLTNEFNHRQTNGIMRDQAELRIKIKNLKAMRVKTEPNDSGSTVFEASQIEAKVEASTPIVQTIIHNRALAQQTSQQHNETPLRIVASHSGGTTTSVRHKNHDIATPGDGYYDEFEVEYIQQKPKATKNSDTDDSKEIERIRKENLLIKNSVLKKKERLLELQIALAERNLRRQI